jgi:hypothetical protein
MDGISGILVNQAFVIPPERHPISYQTSGNPSSTKLGFIVRKVENSIENNQWVTSISGQSLVLPNAVNAPIKKISIENPVGIMSSIHKKPSQIIQPWHFGHEAQKTTCLWLKNLPLLQHTNVVGKGDFYTTPTGKKMASWMCDPVGADGKKLAYGSAEIKKVRNKTFQGIADAMANQWGVL